MPIDRTKPHTVWYWIDDPLDPILAPYAKEFDDADDAEEWAKALIARNLPQLAWVKVFRQSNEVYESLRWDRPDSSNERVTHPPVSGES